MVESELRDARVKMGEYEKQYVLLSSELEGWRSKHLAKFGIHMFIKESKSLRTIVTNKTFRGGSRLIGRSEN